MNLEVKGVTGPNERDYRDVAVLALISVGFLASWTYVFLHPSEGAFAACIGGTGAWGCIFHFLTVRDDKLPDAQ